jgi:RsiW-degrading membrane proteinase PrsW (M82 family)
MILYLNLFLFGFLPPFIWLFYYLEKDVNKESKINILTAFIAGGLMTIPAYFIETFFLSSNIPLSPFLAVFATNFIFVAMFEEVLKFSVFKIGFEKKPFLDEPVDFLIYMITIALGFATFENIFILYQFDFVDVVSTSMVVGAIRFLGPNLLHSVASGLLGFFACWARLRKNHIFTIFGILTAIALHGIFNLLIIKTDNIFNIFLLALILIMTFFALLKSFKILKVVNKNYE